MSSSLPPCKLSNLSAAHTEQKMSTSAWLDLFGPSVSFILKVFTFFAFRTLIYELLNFCIKLDFSQTELSFDAIGQWLEKESSS